MKPKFTFILTIIFGILIVGCKQKEQKVEVEEVKTDLVNDVFPESEEAIRKTMDSIAQSVMDGDIDRLISFHAYSPKFTEFKNGEPRNGGQENEEFIPRHRI